MNGGRGLGSRETKLVELKDRFRVYALWSIMSNNFQVPSPQASHLKPPEAALTVAGLRMEGVGVEGMIVIAVM